MLAQTGKRLTTRITEQAQEKLQAAADIVGTTLISLSFKRHLKRRRSLLKVNQQ